MSNTLDEQAAAERLAAPLTEQSEGFLAQVYLDAVGIPTQGYGGTRDENGTVDDGSSADR
jgi:GH24 family phage-related lysozyme (muramidase)